MGELLPTKEETGLDAIAPQSPFSADSPGCRVCQNLGIWGPYDPRPNFGHMDPDCLGCGLLRAILSSLDVRVDSDSWIGICYRKTEKGIIECSWGLDRQHDLYWCFPGPVDYIRDLSAKKLSLFRRIFSKKLTELKYGAGTQNALLPLITGREVSGDTGSPEAMTWLRQKLAECDTLLQHDECHRRNMSHSPNLPSRVLKISGPNEVRLHVSAQDERGQYVCLSHCWGAKQPITTTKATLDIH
jgi:hypothetical protein